MDLKMQVHQLIERGSNGDIAKLLGLVFGEASTALSSTSEDSGGSPDPLRRKRDKNGKVESLLETYDLGLTEMFRKKTC